MTQEQALREAERLLRTGDVASAERVLASLWPDTGTAPAAVLHLLGLIRRKQNLLAEADVLLRRALAAEPDQARHRVALGDLLLAAGAAGPATDILATALQIDPNFPGARRLFARAALAASRTGDAERAARELLNEAPTAEAWDILSCALRAQDRLEEAVAAGDEALKLHPDASYARHNRACAMLRLGRNEEALQELDSLAASGVEAAPIWLNRGVARLNLTRAEEAETIFADGIRRWPFDVNLQNALANIRWMRGANAAFTRDYEAAIERQPDLTHLRLGCADLLRRAEFRARSEALLRMGLSRQPDNPALLVSLGVLLDEGDRSIEALPLLERAVAGAPGVSQMRANLACALLRLGRGDVALREILPARVAEPLNQEWICYETMALRQIGDPRYHELCDYDLMVQPFDLPVPAGYSNIAEFNQALSASLMRLHVLEAHPLDQSLRNGSQTTRSLLHVDDPVIQEYFAALAEPIRAYMDLMRARDHPWSGRKTSEFKLAGAWSVKLKARGYHINHLHPAGWISSAYYVSLPKVVSEGQSQQGWIKFGEPRWPTPACATEKVVQPQAGRLVLFPSYMWHGTIPFSEGERLTAPFDVVPG
jgi:predicted Zn-dependent protease